MLDTHKRIVYIYQLFSADSYSSQERPGGSTTRKHIARVVTPELSNVEDNKDSRWGAHMLFWCYT
jgi:hypothetical protein